MCIETYTRSSQTWTKTACRATLTQMISSVCNDLEESLKKEMVGKYLIISCWPGNNGYNEQMIDVRIRVNSHVL